MSCAAVCEVSGMLIRQKKSNVRFTRTPHPVIVLTINPSCPSIIIIPTHVESGASGLSHCRAGGWARPVTRPF